MASTPPKDVPTNMAEVISSAARTAERSASATRIRVVVWDCDRIGTVRDRDNRAPTQVAALQDRLPAPSPGDESRLRCGRDQVGTQLNAHKRGGTHSGAHAASGRPEPSRRHSRSLGSNRSRGGVAARFREVAFPMASVKEHQSRTETFARRNIRRDASAPQRLACRPYCLGPTVEFGPFRECRFHPLQIGVDVGRRCRALNVFCLRDLGINTRRYLGWIFNPPR